KQKAEIYNLWQATSPGTLHSACLSLQFRVIRQAADGDQMRKIAIALGTILILLIAVAAVFATTFDINTYRRAIQSPLEKRLGRPVTLGEMRLRLFPIRFSAKELTIGDDPRFNLDAPFLKAQQLDISVKLLPLLHKQLEVDSLTLERPSIDLIKNEAGMWNTASLGRPETVAAQKPQAESAQPGPTTAPPSSSQ